MSEVIISSSSDAGWRKSWRAVSRLLVDPVAAVGAQQRARAQLLATLLLALAFLGLVVAAVQLATVPGFRATFLDIAAAIGALALGYVASRTGLLRIAAAVACAAPVLACSAVALHNPEDGAWYAFMLLSVLFATFFYSVVAASLVAAAVFAVVVGLVIFIPELRASARFGPILAVHVVLSPLLVLGAQHQRRLERERQAAERLKDARLAGMDRLEVLGSVVGSVVHDFNNVLQVIVTNAGVLESSTDGPNSRRAREIRIAGDSAIALGRYLLAFANRQPSQPRAIHLGEVVCGIQPLLVRMAEGVNLQVRSVPGLPLIKADPLRTEQVLMNLVVNAHQAMPDGGTLTIELEQVQLDAAYVAVHPEARLGAHVLMTVIDTGTGMDAATRARAFEPFFSTKGSSGIGVGLATVRAVVTEAGGHIGLDSEPGAGTTFRIYLPALTSSS